MNLYDLHPNPEKAPFYNRRFEIPQVAYDEAVRQCSGFSYTLVRDHEPIAAATAPFKTSCPELEPAISQDPKYAYYYALNILHHMWPEAEPTIAEHPKWACMYAHHIMNKRWYRAERMIASDPYWAVEYAKYVIKGRWHEMEAQLFDSSYWWRYRDMVDNDFIRHVMNNPWR